mgnify:CR=1 FL=1
MALNLVSASKNELTNVNLYGIGKGRLDRFLRFRASLPVLTMEDMKTFEDFNHWKPHLDAGRIVISKPCNIMPLSEGSLSDNEQLVDPFLNHQEGREDDGPAFQQQHAVRARLPVHGAADPVVPNRQPDQTKFSPKYYDPVVDLYHRQQEDMRHHAQRSLELQMEQMRLLTESQNRMIQTQENLAKAIQELKPKPATHGTEQPARVGGCNDPLKNAVPLQTFGRYWAGEDHELEGAAAAAPPPEPKQEPRLDNDQAEIRRVIAARQQLGRPHIEQPLQPPPRRQVQQPAAQPLRVQPPKLPSYDGKADGSTSWSAFILKFERMAARQQWPNDLRLDRLIDCLKESALEFFVRLPEEVRENYNELRQRLQLRFGLEDTPSVARRKLQEAKQSNEESLEEFAGRVQRLAATGYPATPMATIQAVSADAFLKGCKERLAAFLAMNGEPATIEEALRLMKAAVTNQTAVFGNQPISKVRQVLRFEDDVDAHVRTINVEQSMVLKVKNIEKELADLRTQMDRRHQEILKALHSPRVDFHVAGEPPGRSGRSPSPRRQWEPQRSRSPSPARTDACYNCGGQGHFSRDCPKRLVSRPRSPSPSARSLNQ